VEILSYLKPYHRVIALAGAFIVFMTYIAKDGKKEHLDHLVTAITTAENQYLIRSDSADLRKKVDILARQFMAHAQNPTKPLERWTSVDEDEIDYDWQDDVRDGVKAQERLLDNVVRLTDQLHFEKNRDDQINRIIADYNKFWKQSDEIDKLTAAAEQAKESKKATASKEAMNILSDAQIAWSKLAAGLGDQLDAISGPILEEAGKERVETEKKYRRWSDISGLLYGIGWSLGVLGIVGGAGGSDLPEV
jgi:hypothetical protein